MERKKTMPVALTSLVLLVFLIQFVRAEPDKPLVYVIVDSAICDQIKSQIEIYSEDVKRIGFDVVVVSFDQCTPADVKGVLTSAYSEGLVGCLLIGDIPAVIFEDREEDKEEYPIDMWYMDLNGVWVDNDANGKYENHTGHRAPEIWLGRIKPPVATDEVALIQDYFQKNHDYRTGLLSLPKRALAYIDDSWVDSSDAVDSALALCYSDRTLVNDCTATQSLDYLDRLRDDYHFVHLMVHGNHLRHDFQTNGSFAGSVSYEDVRAVGPHAFFYNLFTCSSAKYTKTDYIGGWYIFNNAYGLAAVGPTDAGGMWFFEDFYGHLSENNLGSSFKSWLTTRIIAEDSGTWYTKDWYYGMSLLGDPTLSLEPDVEEPDVERVDVAITHINPYRTVLSNRTSTSINVTIQNQGNIMTTLSVTLDYNMTPIGTQTVTLLASQSATLTFKWNTTSIPLGDYQMVAQATILPNETDIKDNEFIGGWVEITIPGDVNPNGAVNIRDLLRISRAFDSCPGDSRWNPNADQDENRVINVRDMLAVAKEYGKTV